MNHSKQLGEGSIPKLLIKFSIPAIIGMVVTALYNVVDRIFVGQGVGSKAIAGIGVGFPFMILMMGFGMLTAFGATALISIRLGEHKKEEAELILGNAVLLLVGVYFILSVIGLIFIDPLLRLFGASSEILPYAREYLRIILYGGVFSGIAFGMNHMIRAEGSPRFAMVTMLLGALLNTILDPIFIFVFHWGIAGAAWATILSQAISAGWVVSYYLRGKSTLKIRRANFRLRPEIVRRILAIGSAPFALQVAASVVTIILNHSLVTYGGDLAISAINIVNSIAMLILMPIFGINQGVQPIIGYNYGARRFDRVKKALKLAIAAATSIVLLGFILTQFFATPMIRLFNAKDAELIRLGSHALRVFLIMLPLIGMQIVSSNYFQATGKPKQAMVLSLSRQVLFLIPALLILPRFFGLEGVFWAGPASDLLSSIVTAIWLLHELRHLDARHVAETQSEDLELSQVDWN